MRNYLNLGLHTLIHGTDALNARSIFGPQLEFDLRMGFPAITTRKLDWVSAVYDLQRTLLAENPTGVFWRAWDDGARCRKVDQLSDVITLIKTNPFSDQILMSSWNVPLVTKLYGPPTHVLVQFNVGFTDQSPLYLDCKATIRSVDLYDRLPINIAQYALLTHIVAKLVNLQPRMLYMSLGKVSLRDEHAGLLDQENRRSDLPFPTLVLPEFSSIDEAAAIPRHKFGLDNYRYYKEPVAE